MSRLGLLNSDMMRASDVAIVYVPFKAWASTHLRLRPDRCCEILLPLSGSGQTLQFVGLLYFQDHRNQITMNSPISKHLCSNLPRLAWLGLLLFALAAPSFAQTGAKPQTSPSPAAGA